MPLRCYYYKFQIIFNIIIIKYIIKEKFLKDYNKIIIYDYPQLEKKYKTFKSKTDLKKKKKWNEY